MPVRMCRHVLACLYWAVEFEWPASQRPQLTSSGGCYVLPRPPLGSNIYASLGYGEVARFHAALDETVDWARLDADALEHWCAAVPCARAV